MSESRTLLIDADILLYRAITSIETEIEVGDDEFVTHCDIKEAESSFVSAVDNLVNGSGLGKYKLCFSDTLNFRKDILPTYKMKRSRKPVGFKQFKANVMKRFSRESVMRPKIEADDCIGILTTKYKDDFVIWSDDKDLDQIPGDHYKSKLNSTVTISEPKADFWFYQQVLSGDAVDNYVGCPGIGPKTAEKILVDQSIETNGFWSSVVDAYKKRGLSYDDVLIQARVARILRDSDWNSTTSEVILWQPSV